MGFDLSIDPSGIGNAMSGMIGGIGAGLQGGFNSLAGAMGFGGVPQPAPNASGLGGSSGMLILLALAAVAFFFFMR
jgi:hypothetical protein